MVSTFQQRYPTDLTDAQWNLIGPLIPPAKPGGNDRTTNIREVINAILYLLRTGCAWRTLPKDFHPRVPCIQLVEKDRHLSTDS